MGNETSNRNLSNFVWTSSCFVKGVKKAPLYEPFAAYLLGLDHV